MKKKPSRKRGEQMREEYDLSALKGGVRGKYYEQARASSNLVLIDPDLMQVFPDTDAVNRALRLLARTAQAAVGGTQLTRSGRVSKIQPDSSTVSSKRIRQNVKRP